MWVVLLVVVENFKEYQDNKPEVLDSVYDLDKYVGLYAASSDSGGRLIIVEKDLFSAEVVLNTLTSILSQDISRFDSTVSICSNAGIALSREAALWKLTGIESYNFHKIFYKTFEDWEHYSGNLVYPVPDPDYPNKTEYQSRVHSSGKFVSACNRKELYTGNYGKLRLHLAARLKQVIESEIWLDDHLRSHK